jgi:diguanylate cyclase (GGDEF)-like protein
MHGPLRQPTLLRPLLVVVLGLSFTGLTWYSSDRAERRREADELGERATRNVERLRDYVHDSLAPLPFVAGLAAGGELDEARLRRVLDEALQPESPLRYVAWAPRVLAADLEAWQAARQSQRPGFRIAGLNGGASLGGSSHVVIDHVWPDERAADLDGLDLASDPGRSAAFERALADDRSGLVLSQRVDLVLPADDEGKAGVMACIPVYAEGRPLRTEDDRRAALRGFVVGECATKRLVESAFARAIEREGPEVVCIEVWDGTDLLGAAGRARPVESKPFAQAFDIDGRTWTVQTLPAVRPEPTLSELLERTSTLLPAAVLVVMLLISGIVYVLVRQNDVIRRQVAAQTAELRDKNQALADKEFALNEANRRLTEMSHTDPLTGIFNRRAFETQFDQERERSARSGVPYGLLLFDIDHFKGFNDLYGHVAGDDVLRRVANVIRNEARRIDCVARYGGEEFAVLASGADAAGLVSLGERIRARVQEAAIENKSAPLGVITLSGGGALSASVKGRDPKELIQMADRCLYSAKTSGRNRIAVVG